MDYFLKFDSKKEAESVLISVGIGNNTIDPDSDVPVFVVNEGYAVDQIGEIFDPTGKTITREDFSYQVMAPVYGYHVNVRGPETEGLESYTVNPVSPRRVWA